MILSSVSDAIVTQVGGLHTVHEVWLFLEQSFVSQQSVRAVSLHLQLQALKKGDKSVTDFLQQAKAIADRLAIIGKPIFNDEYQSYLFQGLGPEYENLEDAITARINPSPAMISMQCC